jgi:hypothetical protein
MLFGLEADMGQRGAGFTGCLVSLMGFVLFVAGLAGLAGYFGFGGDFLSAEVIQSAFKYVEGMAGSLLIPSGAATGVGLLLLVAGLSSGDGHRSSNKETGVDGYKGMIITCHKCGQNNPAYAAVCSNCKARLTMADN